MIRLTFSLCAALSLLSTSAFAQTPAPAPKPSAKATVAKSSSKPPTQRQKLASEAKNLALAADTVEAITENRLEIAMRVLTGSAQCEFNQQVSVEAMAGRPGHFKVGFNKLHYVMTPEETTTGAVRLEDKKAGVVWIQIPVKSMLMNHKIGQRMVDDCTQTEQRVAVEAAKTAILASAADTATATVSAPAPATSAPAAATAPAPEPAASAPTPAPAASAVDTMPK